MFQLLEFPSIVRRFLDDLYYCIWSEKGGERGKDVSLDDKLLALTCVNSDRSTFVFANETEFP